jgi:hypothetical protein
VLDDADVLDRVLLHELEEAADSRRMHFDGEVIRARVGGGDRGGGLAHARSDLGDDGRLAAESRLEIESRLRIGNAEPWQQLYVGTLLAAREASLSQDVATDGWMGHGKVI